MVGRVKNVGIRGKPLKSELHHWWPRGLSRLWEDDRGKVMRLSWDGSERRTPPKQFGAITNAHHINVGGPWSTSIEPMFGDADSALPGLATKLESLSYIERERHVAFDRRIMPHELDPQDRKLLGEALASLLVRCPAHRNILHLTAESVWGRTGDQVRKHDDTLIAANIHQHYQNVVSSLARGGKIVLLRSGTGEFIMGEGYLSTLVGLTVEIQYHCLVPLTPTLAVLAFAPLRYRTDPPICTIGLMREEVDIVNNVTQIYSRDYIFYRNEAPKLIDAFRAREFRIFQYHRFPWLEAVMQTVAAYLPG
jgi:Protein of unknown function (DUF4238)